MKVILTGKFTKVIVKFIYKFRPLVNLFYTKPRNKLMIKILYVLF